MKRKNNKGFTLVELLAVTIILIIIFLIAINAIGDRTKKSKMDSVKASALGYFKAVRLVCETSTGDDSPFKMGDYTISELADLGVQISGKKPKSGFIYFEDNEPYCGCVAYGKYKVEYVNEKFSEVKKGTCSKTKMNCKAHSKYQITEIDYTGTTEQIPIIKDGNYKIEVWGAEGGTAVSSGRTSNGGYGGYSTGYIYLTSGTTLYVNVGGKGNADKTGSGNVNKGGYNGGGDSTQDSYGVGASGGGSTSIAFASGLLSELTDNKSSIIIVAGGGGAGGIETGGAKRTSHGGSGGGFIGVSGSNTGGLAVGTGGTQTSGSQFGRAGNSTGWYGAPGGGYYGGFGGCGMGGGSGYIGNSDLTSAVMYCYNCDESPVAEIKTISTDCVSEKPTKNCAKKGNGYARITMYRTIESDDDYDD